MRDAVGVEVIAEEWSQGEVVRALTRLSEALEKFEGSVEQTFSALDQTYVRKDVYEAAMSTLRDARESSQSWVRDLVSPVVTGVVLAGLLWALSAVGGR